MSQQLIAKSTIKINTSAHQVWDALTNPALIKKYFFGTDAVSDWQVGSPITFTGEWEGKEYKDKGEIKAMTPEKLLRYTYLSSMSGKEDVPENYANVEYILSEDDGVTTLTITQDGIADEKGQAESEKNWGMVLDGIKKMLES